MKIKTIYGLSNFEGIKRVKVEKLLKFEFESGKIFKCTPEQIIYVEKDLPVWAECLSVGEEIEVDNKKEKIVNIEELTGSFYVYDLLHVDEGKNTYLCSGLNISNCEEFWISNYPAVSSFSNSKVIIISTPKGKFNVFYDLYTNARTVQEKKEYDDAIASGDENLIKEIKEKQGKKNAFISAKFSYDAVPGRDEEWAKEQKAIIGETKFIQEYACIGKDVHVSIDNLENEIKVSDLYEQLRKENFGCLQNLVKNIKNHKVYTPNRICFFFRNQKTEKQRDCKNIFWK